MLWQPGQRVHDRYQLVSLKRDRLGHQVWLAQDQQSQATVILKTLAFTGDIQWDEVKLFEREIEILQKLNHPQIPAFVDTFTQEKPYYCKCLVEQYIHAPSLQAFLDRHQVIPENQIWAIATQILNILQDLHQGQPRIIHRDLKPSNILIDAHKKVYLIDLGAVGRQGEPRRAQDAPTTVGSYGYTPIEQFMGQAVPASDLYALGATLMHLLTQTHPADLLNPQLRLALPTQLDISAPLKHWLYQLTAPQVSDRPYSAAIAGVRLTQAQTHDQMLAQPPSETRLVVNSDQDAILVQPVWNEQTMATRDILTLVGISVLPLLLGGIGTISALSHTQGMGLWGTELLILLMSLLPFGLLIPRLGRQLVSQSIYVKNAKIQTQWNLLGIQIRRHTLPEQDIPTLQICTDASQSWSIQSNIPAQTSFPVVSQLNGHDLEQVYRTLERWWLSAL